MPEPAARLAGRSGLRRASSARLPDRLLRWGLTALAAGVLALLAFFLVRLVLGARPAFTSAGVTGFVVRDDWDPGVSAYHGGALLAGTLITSAIALVLGVPIALATALYTTELCPLRFRPVLTLLVELLAAVPSIVYGLWGVVFLIPNLRGPSQWFADTFAALPFVGGHVAGPSYLVAGLVLAIMIIPIVSAISGDVLASVPEEEKAAAYALGCTRWEMIRLAALPHARPGIIGAALLGLGRAIGETIAVLLVIGGATRLGEQLFAPGTSLAAVIANEFDAAATVPPHRAALLAAGLVLFVLTLLVNVIARWYVVRPGPHRAPRPPA